MVDVSLRDALHGFWQGRGVETATVEAKMDQKLVVICHEMVFQPFFGVNKSY